MSTPEPQLKTTPASAGSHGSANRQELLLRGVGIVSLMDLDSHLLNLRRSLNSMAGHMRKASRQRWSEKGAKQIMDGVSRSFKKQAEYVQECRSMLGVIQEIIKPKPEEISPNDKVSDAPDSAAPNWRQSNE